MILLYCIVFQTIKKHLQNKRCLKLPCIYVGSLINPVYKIDNRTNVMMNAGIKQNKVTSKDCWSVFIAQYFSRLLVDTKVRYVHQHFLTLFRQINKIVDFRYVNLIRTYFSERNSNYFAYDVVEILK